MELMTGYKHSDVGVIPEEWEAYRLGELLQAQRSIRYGIVQPGKFDATGCYMLRSQDYSKGWAGPDGMHKVSPQLENQYHNARIRYNDLVITVVGAGIGQIEVVPDWLDGAILSRSTARISIDEDKAARSYVRAFLEGPTGKRQILGCQKEGAQPVVSCLDLAEFFVAYPPLKEQRAISQALSDVDALIATLEKMIAKKRDLKQAAMQQLLTGEKRLPGFTGDWVLKSFGDLFDFSGGYSASRDQLSNEGHCYLHYGDIHGSSKTSVNTRRDFLDIPKLSISLGRISEGSLLKHGDVVFVDASEDDAGTSKHLVIENEDDVPFISGLHTIVAKSKENDLAHAYKHYCFQTPAIRQQFMFYAVGTKVSGISKTNIAKLTLPIPSISEQIAIADVLSSMDVELANLEARRDKTRNIKQAMMQELLTGKTRLVEPRGANA
jgi:type I restriction enzyme, S subunit